MKEITENKQFRVLYFIGIFLVVANHFGGGSISLLYEWFPAYSFHLGLFMFCSGYLIFKNRNDSFFHYIKKNILKLLVPLYFWNIIYGLIIIFLHTKGFTIGETFNLFNIFIKPIYNGHQFVFTLATWFIFPLLFLKIINYCVIKLFRDNSKLFIIYFIISLIFGFLGVNLAMKGYNHGGYLLLVKIMYFSPFFALGMLYNQVFEKYDNLNSWVYFAIIFILTLTVTYVFGGTKEYVAAWCNNFDNIFRPFIVGILGILFWLRVSKILEPVLSKSKLIMTVSRNTYDIVIHHIMGYFILNYIYYRLSVNFFTDFNAEAFKNNIYYFYTPKGINNFLILYLVFGFGFSLLMIYLKKVIRRKIKKKEM